MFENLDVKKVYADTLNELIAQNKNIYVVDADLRRISGNQGVYEKNPGHHVNVGIAEQNLVGISAGIAAMGKTVFASTFSNFIVLRGCDQITNAVCYNELDVKLCGFYSGLTSGVNGGTHISVSDVAIMRTMPGMTVIDPGDGIELARALEVAASNPGPYYIRISRGPMPTVFPADHSIELGKGVVFRQAREITLITSGVTVVEAVKAAEMLKQEGIEVGHIHLPFIKPIDETLILDAAEKSRYLITVENHSVIGGLGSAVAETISKDNACRLIRMGINDCFAEGKKYEDLIEDHNISSNAIFKQVKELIEN